MEKNKIDEIITLMSELEENYTKLNESLLELNIISRNDMVKQISQDIIKNNKIFLERGNMQLIAFKKEQTPAQAIVEGVISNIRSKPSKKIVYLREFLEKLTGISETDGNVIIQSVSSKDLESLRNELETLLKIFKLIN